MNFLEKKLSKIDNLFEKYNDITDEIVRYDRLWISVAEYIHPGEYSGVFPKTYLMFDKLRNGKIVNYNSVLEKAITEKNIHKAIYLLTEKPGIFARKLHEILEISGKQQLSILSTFEEVGTKLQVKNLLVMKKYFESIDKQEKRTIINKKGKIKIVENKLKK
ncbi:MAG: hypothetical protein Q8K30_04490 [Candidatus Gracilibacteria bacterium]|nr:hypothetical protein [Candidatus Gracilibacteria bacterium]